MKNNVPYIITKRVVVERKYNPDYGDDRECICGHPYYRHFDTYEDMYNCGCKYCGCGNFQEKVEGDKIFLLRVNDYDVWEEDPGKPGCYRSMSTRSFGENRQDAYDHWTFENLTRSHDFVAISEAEIPEYLEKHEEHYKFLAWQSRNDGHGGAKGGTYEEYLEHIAAVKSFNEKYPDWKKERDERIKNARDERIKNARDV